MPHRLPPPLLREAGGIRPLLEPGRVIAPLTFARAQVSSSATADAVDIFLELIAPGRIDPLLPFARAQVDSAATGDVP